MKHKTAFFLLTILFCATWLVVPNTPAQGETDVVANFPTEPLVLEWEFNTLVSEGDVGSHMTMAVQPTTHIPSLAYYDATNGLMLATRTGNGNCGPANQWQCTAVLPADGAASGIYPALAFRGDGSYGLAYQNATAAASFYDGQTMVSTPIIPNYQAGWGNGRYNTITYDVNSKVHIFTLENNNTHHGLGYYSDDQALVDANCPQYPQCYFPSSTTVNNIATHLDILGRPTVVYSDTNFDLYYARRMPSGTGGNCMKGVWTCTHVDDLYPAQFDARFNDLGLAYYQAQCLLGYCDHPITIASYSFERETLYDMEYVGGSQGTGCTNTAWNCGYIDTVGKSYASGGESSRWRMGLDFVSYEGYLLVFYQDYNDQLNAIIKMAYRVPEGTGNCGTLSKWQCVVVDDGERGGGFVDVGYGLQAEVVDGRILLAYHDLNHKDLVIAETVLPPSHLYLPFVGR